jgi:hypothetical protein
MSVRRSRARSLAAVAAWVLLVQVVASGLTSAPQGNQRCCFKNSAYSGTCVVDPAPGETCASILEYLNSPNTVGKTYCNGTRIRGGWTVAACDSQTGDLSASR